MRHSLSIVALTLTLVALVSTAPAEDEKAPSPPAGTDFTEQLRNFGGQAQKAVEDLPNQFKDAASQVQNWAQGAGETVSKTATDVFGRFGSFFNPSGGKKSTGDDDDA